MNLKQDRQGVRTPRDIERKYNLGDISAVAEVAAAAQRAATNAQSVANDANAMSTQANATAKEASATAKEAKALAEAVGENVYNKEQTLSSEVKALLGLADTATPSEAFAALYNLIAGEDPTQ